MQNIKLIVTDMDGTLLRSDNSLSPEFNKIYKKLKENNIIFVPASGRQYYSIVNYFEDIKDDLAVIAENGTYVTYKGKEVFVDNLNWFIVKEIIREVRKIEGANIVLATKNTAYVESRDETFLEYFKNYYNKNVWVEDLTKIENEQFIKIAINHTKGTEKNVYPKLVDFEKNGLKVVVSGEVWLDVMNKNTNKGVALQALINKLNISPEEIIVFGDFMNDLEMLNLAKYSFAMKNAHPDIIKTANFIAPSNNEDGVIQIIKQYLQQLEVVNT
ncbi:MULTISPECIES: HAD family hydrolase [Empedobacter]|uniref:HAD family phosphatase n=1 Tax=Empedobacter tilapiae TaxID=2491114 RepID=A0A4Z1B7G5_9FLAO|nr:HAD family hydrolase [Empedobacter tilapiae]TGN26398.1 HAD family phosphatase [Empedobacter tilapiae]